MILKDLIPILKCDAYDIELGKSTIQVESLDNEFVRMVEDGEVLEVTAWADECARHLVVVLK
nr:MAG TPA: hypothetical protein [Bacteriophage sp.]